MFIPPNSTKLEDLSDRRRVAIQGAGGTGKTTAALTFPNPIVVDIDNSVDLNNARAVGIDPSTVTVLPFYREDYQKTIMAVNRPNVKDCFEKWLEENIRKFAPEQTVIIDSWTFLQDAFDKFTPIPIAKQSGAEDRMSWWGMKADWSQEILTTLQSAQCNIVMIFHEVEERDDKGRLTGKVKPMMQGRFADKLQNYFPYWFRQFTLDKITDREKQEAEIKAMGISRGVFEEIQNSSAPYRPSYIWQTVTSNLAKCKTKIPFARFIPAHYKVFVETSKFLQT